MSDGEWETVDRDDGITVVYRKPEVPDTVPTCVTYIEAADLLEVLCVSTHEGHRCRLHWQSQTHVRADWEGGQWVSRCRCACGNTWETT